MTIEQYVKENNISYRELARKLEISAPFLIDLKNGRRKSISEKVANKFKSDITLSKDDDEINAKSIMGIITLAATYQTVLTLKADGADEAEAVEAISKIFENKFEEE